MVRYVQAVKGQAPIVKKHLPFLCPDVDYLERMLESLDAMVILAKVKDAIIGVAGGRLEGTPSGYDVEDTSLREHSAYHEAHLDWIAVQDEYREKGIGKSLIERVCNWAKRKGKKKIWTEAQRKTTGFDSVAFYKKLGFKEIGNFRDEKREEFVTILKKL